MKETRQGQAQENPKKEKPKSGGVDPRVSYNSSKVHHDIEKRLVVPSLNQGLFTNQAIMENQANFERDTFMLKLQRSDQDIQLERLRGETLLLEKKTTTNVEVPTDGTKTMKLDDTTNELDTQDLDLTVTPAEDKRSRAHLKKPKLTNKLSKQRKKVIELKKSRNRSSVRSSRPGKETIHAAETVNTIRLDPEEVTSMEQMSGPRAIPNMFSPATSLRDPYDHTFSQIQSEEPAEQLPKNARDAVLMSSQLQKKYGFKNQLNKRLNKDFQVKHVRVKKQIKVDESDRQKMIIAATIG